MTSPDRPSPPQHPLTFSSDAAAITAAADAACLRAEQVIASLLVHHHHHDGPNAKAQADTATFDTLMLPLLQLENEFQMVSNAAVLRAMVGGTGSSAEPSAVDKAARAAVGKMSGFLEGLKSSQDGKKLGAVLEGVYQRELAERERGASKRRLDDESWKALCAERRREASRRGVDADCAQRIAEVEARLGEITAAFHDNLRTAEDYLWLTREELGGVPAASIDTMEKDDRAASEGGEVKFKIRLTGHQPRTLLSQLSSSEARRKVYLGMRNVAKSNIPLFHEAVELRRELAQLRGYDSHVAYKVENMMAKTPSNVGALLDGLRKKVLAGLPRDLETLRALKTADQNLGQDAAESNELTWADLTYYTQLYEQQNLSLDQDMIAQHFPLLPTVRRMLDLFGELFGFEFHSVEDTKHDDPEESLVWHKDVKLYSVWNSASSSPSEFVGYLYLDLHPRPGKTLGAQCRPLHLGFHSPSSENQRHYPSTVLMTDFPPDSHLQHADVTLLFHELGHGIHDLAGKCLYSRHHGAETAGDFNEAPSQMLENWCWDARALRKLATPVTDARGGGGGEQVLSDEAVEALVRSRNVLPAIKMMAQLRVTLFDNAVHAGPAQAGGSSGGDGGIIDVEALYKEFNELGGLNVEGDEHGYTTYAHLFSGNDGTMYAYLWSKAIAQDLWESVFARDLLDGEAGRRYRHAVLEKGGSQDEMKTLVDFLGREPEFEGFWKGLGLERA